MIGIGLIRLALIGACYCCCCCCGVDAELYCGAKKCAEGESRCLLNKENPRDVSCLSAKSCEEVCDGDTPKVNEECCCYSATEEEDDAGLRQCGSLWRKRRGDDEDDDNGDDGHHGGHSLNCYVNRVEPHYSHKSSEPCYGEKGRQACWITPKPMSHDPSGHYHGGLKQGCWHHDGEHDSCESVIKKHDGCCCKTNLCNKDMDTCKESSGGDNSTNNPFGGSPRGVTTPTFGVVVAIAATVCLFFAAAAV